MAIGHAGFRRLAWIMAGGLTLAGVALGCCLWPEWKTQEPGLQLAPPRFTFTGSEKTAGPEAREMRMVLSPTLIALDQAMALPGHARKPGQGMSPPAGPPLERPDGLGMPPLARDLTLLTEGGSVLRRKDITGAGVFSRIFKSPALPKEPDAGSRAVILEYSGGLAGKSIEVEGWSWNRWTQAGVSWVLDLDLQSDSQGRITQVLVDAPPADASLNEALVQSLYQGGRVQPAGPCRGRVRISFAGAQ